MKINIPFIQEVASSIQPYIDISNRDTGMQSGCISQTWETQKGFIQMIDLGNFKKDYLDRVRWAILGVLQQKGFEPIPSGIPQVEFPASGAHCYFGRIFTEIEGDEDIDGRNFNTTTYPVVAYLYEGDVKIEVEFNISSMTY